MNRWFRFLEKFLPWFCTIGWVVMMILFVILAFIRRDTSCIS